uniref:Uncharacterized protein n=1 Tax=Picea glauca TaxID=3330 RepID=A0A101LXJ2_PICGL|nr:hypothetical protein ABT39_MTgene6195 [Picea glauca]QHR88716.1 hypothetical protein Q903MT_gene2730 [Picea sitchensis]
MSSRQKLSVEDTITFPTTSQTPYSALLLIPFIKCEAKLACFTGNFSDCVLYIRGSELNSVSCIAIVDPKKEKCNPFRHSHIQFGRTAIICANSPTRLKSSPRTERYLGEFNNSTCSYIIDILRSALLTHSHSTLNNLLHYAKSRLGH